MCRLARDLRRPEVVRNRYASGLAYQAEDFFTQPVRGDLGHLSITAKPHRAIGHNPFITRL